MIGYEAQARIAEAIAELLKKRFPNLTVEETLKLTHHIAFTVYRELEKENA